MFLDDQMTLFAHLDQAKIAKALHKQADAWPGCANHRRQFFVGNPQFDADAARVFFAQFSCQLQQGFTKALFAVYSHQIGNDYLLIGNPHGKVFYEAYK